MSLHDTSASSLSLVDETALDDPTCRELGLIFSKEEFEGFDHQFKRRLAAMAESDEVDGKTDGIILRSFFVRQKTLTDFE
jgi:hypothetical protein